MSARRCQLRLLAAEAGWAIQIFSQTCRATQSAGIRHAARKTAAATSFPAAGAAFAASPGCRPGDPTEWTGAGPVAASRWPHHAGRAFSALHVNGVDDIKLKLQYDFYYIRNFSIWLDILIVMKTIKTMLTGCGHR